MPLIGQDSHWENPSLFSPGMKLPFSSEPNAPFLSLTGFRTDAELTVKLHKDQEIDKIGTLHTHNNGVHLHVQNIPPLIKPTAQTESERACQLLKGKLQLLDAIAQRFANAVKPDNISTTDFYPWLACSDTTLKVNPELLFSRAHDGYTDGYMDEFSALVVVYSEFFRGKVPPENIEGSLHCQSFSTDSRMADVIDFEANFHWAPGFSFGGAMKEGDLSTISYKKGPLVAIPVIGFEIPGHPSIVAVSYPSPAGRRFITSTKTRVEGNTYQQLKSATIDLSFALDLLPSEYKIDTVTIKCGRDVDFDEIESAYEVLLDTTSLKIPSLSSLIVTKHDFPNPEIRALMQIEGELIIDQPQVGD